MRLRNLHLHLSAELKVEVDDVRRPETVKNKAHTQSSTPSQHTVAAHRQLHRRITHSVTAHSRAYSHSIQLVTAHAVTQLQHTVTAYSLSHSHSTVTSQSQQHARHRAHILHCIALQATQRAAKTWGWGHWARRRTTCDDGRMKWSTSSPSFEYIWSWCSSQSSSAMIGAMQA